MGCFVCANAEAAMISARLVARIGCMRRTLAESGQRVATVACCPLLVARGAGGTENGQRRTENGQRRTDNGEREHDSKTELWRISPLFAQERPENRQAPESRNVQVEGGGGEARARGAVLQTALRCRFPRP